LRSEPGNDAFKSIVSYLPQLVIGAVLHRMRYEDKFGIVTQ